MLYLISGIVLLENMDEESIVIGLFENKSKAVEVYELYLNVPYTNSGKHLIDISINYIAINSVVEERL